MKKLEMLPSWRIGHPVIDADHGKLIAITNDIFDTIEDLDFELCEELLKSFVELARDHFRREERILIEIKFPGAQTHIQYHQGLLEKAEETRKLCTEMADRQRLIECFRELAGFLVDDVVKGDMSFKSFMIEAGIIEPRD
ncbi:MAG: hemerythrin domain-containing protein [Rhodospirillales bacterium]|jgi:hemerythrin-like metal-binding protein|nr:hemerythrin domain-containing protein [Rhodospirillales bacterium]MDP7214913.1 hemerythrin domain-containing protein [Rhodospirillales bacterium]HIJ43941.1 hypothetical protein [Rhodospirillaceae bacterium]HIJ92777.1 hypothetical protein [Rhodospirillaceae bacterium]HJP53810.1 hemerythrin domain-containing protein [Rhodospirillales bacterium]